MAAALALPLLVACPKGDSGRVPEDPDPPGPETWSVDDALVRLELLADSRRGAAEAMSFVYHAESRVRAAAVRAVGHIGDVESVTGLVRLMEHDDRAVRLQTAFAFYQLPQWFVDDEVLRDLKVGQARDALIARLPREEDEKVQREILRALASLGGEEAATAIRGKLTFAGSPGVTSWAAMQLGLWSRSPAGRALNTEEVSALLDLPTPWSVQEGGEAVERGVIYALSRAETDAGAKARLREALPQLLGRGDASQRAWAITALGRAQQAAPDAPVASPVPLTAVDLFGLSAAERIAWARALPSYHYVSEPGAGSWELAEGMLRDPDPFVAQAVAESLGDGTGLLPEEVEPRLAVLRATLDDDRPEVRCAGLSRLQELDPTERATLIPSPEAVDHPQLAQPGLRACLADGLGSLLGVEGADADGIVALLLRLADDQAGAVRLAALAALLELPDPLSQPATTERMTRALSGERAVEVELIAALLGPTPDKLSTERIGTLLTTLPAEPRLTFARTALLDILAQRKEGPAELLSELRSDPDWFVRRSAGRAMAAILEVPPDPTAPREESAPGPEPASLPSHLRIRTDAGEVLLRTRPDLAPRTVERMTRLAADGYFDGTVLHRVVPGFVAQGGDPGGTGWGGPDEGAMRCELSPAPYRAGTVGMALAGRDTGGSQFFIALDDFPHLEGRYSVWAEVEEGMEIVRTWRRGTVLNELRPVSGSPAP